MYIILKMDILTLYLEFQDLKDSLRVKRIKANQLCYISMVFLIALLEQFVMKKSHLDWSSLIAATIYGWTILGETDIQEIISTLRLTPPKMNKDRNIGISHSVKWRNMINQHFGLTSSTSHNRKSLHTLATVKELLKCLPHFQRMEISLDQNAKHVFC
jgi:hypothetical protein